MLILFSALSLTVQAAPYYVVVGTFSEAGRAEKFAASIRGLFHDATARFDAASRLHHVHVLEASQETEAEDFRDYVQKEKGFDAWVYTDLGALSRTVGESAAVPEDVRLELFTGGSVLLASADNSHLSIRRSYAEKKDTTETSDKVFRFIAETTTGRPMAAQVLIMSRSGSTLATFKSGEVVTFGTGQSTRRLTLVCQTDGYGTVTKNISLHSLTGVSDIHQNSAGVWEVRFRLTKIKVDDVRLLHHGLFLHDAAVLQPDAKNGVAGLLTLLNRNPSWKIVVNSHCNPGGKRDIVIPTGKGNYFDAAATTKRSGSDKHLASARAETLRDYLADHGIDPARISVMGWGSLNPVASPKDARAYLNDRVEVEVVF